MLNRRTFLKTSGLLLAGTAVGGQLLTSCTSAPKVTKTIGLQLYSLRGDVKDRGIAETLKSVAEMGYKTVEAAGYSEGKFYGMAPAEFKALVEANGLKCTSSHVGKGYDPEKLPEIMEWWNQCIAAHNELGVKYVVMPSPPIKLQDATEEQLIAMRDYLEDVGVNFNTVGIRFGYHNHKTEFLPFGDATIMDWLLANSDPTRFTMELDVYWIAQAGLDPVAFIDKWADRIELLHIKDEKEIGASGQIDFKAIFEKAYEKGKMQAFFIEQEAYSFPELESVKKSFDYINEAEYVK